MQFSHYDKVPQNVQMITKTSIIMENQNIRIHLKAYDNKILDLSTEEIVNKTKRTGHRLKDQFHYLQELRDILFYVHHILIKKVENSLSQEHIRD